MLIMSLHQGISKWAASTTEAWSNGSYCTALLYSIITRIASIAGLIFQICYLPLHLITTIQQARLAYSVHKMDSGFHGFIIALKTACLGISILICGSFLSTLSIFIPEIAYTTLKAQKPIYAQQIISQIDTHPGIERGTLISIRQHLNDAGFHFCDFQFEEFFRTVWQQNAIWKNSTQEFGEPDIEKTMQRSLENAVAEYVVKQLEALEQIDPALHQEVLRRLQPADRQQTTHTAAQQLRSHYSPETVQLGRILFAHMQIAARDLLSRKCFDADQLSCQMEGSYFAVMSLAILNMVAGAKLSTVNNSEALEISLGTSQVVKLDSKRNIFNLLPGFVDLKNHLDTLQAGRQSEEKSLYEECYKLLINRLSFSENKEVNAKIDKGIKELSLKKKELEKLETEIFKRIGALVATMNQRIVTLSSLGINWSQAFNVNPC